MSLDDFMIQDQVSTLPIGQTNRKSRPQTHAIGRGCCYVRLGGML